MTPELYGALALLGTSVIGVLGLLVRYIGIKLQASIKAATKAADAATEAVAENTTLTKDIHRATNGRLASAINRVQVLTIERDTYHDMVAYVLSTPDGKRILAEFAERRRIRVADPDLVALLAMQLPEERH